MDGRAGQAAGLQALAGWMAGWRCYLLVAGRVVVEQ